MSESGRPRTHRPWTGGRQPADDTVSRGVRFASSVALVLDDPASRRLAGAACDWRTRMCLGVPGRIVDIDGMLATVDFFGVKRQVRLELVDEPVQPGDYILNHVGFAIRRIPEEDIQGTLDLYAQLLKEAEADLMAEDVRGEVDATRGSGDGR
jgi:hydrogenase expression/formation protein HypC